MAAILMLLTVTGNFLVIVSYKINYQLQTINNMFLVSLACSDLIIGVVSMSLYPVYMITGTWTLGPALCDTWLCIDYTLSMASVANLMLICLDRYFSVTKPFTYRAKRTTKRACIFIVLAWVLSFLLWSPAIIIWPRVRERTVGDQCFIQFLEEDKSLTVITAIIAFYLPVIIMCVLYGLIFRETRKCSQYLEYLKSYRKRRPTVPNPVQQSSNIIHRESMPSFQDKSSVSNSTNQAQFLSADQSDMKSNSSRFRIGSFSLTKPNMNFTDRSDRNDINRKTQTNPEQTDTQTGEKNPTSGGAKNKVFKNFSNNFYNLLRSKRSNPANGSTSDEGLSEGNASKEVAFPLLPTRKVGLSRRCKSEPIALQNALSCSKTTLQNNNTNQIAVEKCDELNTLMKADPLKKRRTSRDDWINDAPSRKGSAVVKMPSTEKKAARTLSAILLAFIVTWVPYNICAVYKSFCLDADNCISQTVWDIAYYLCYINSTINPFCFALCNKTFRKTFKRILSCQRCRPNRFYVNPKPELKNVKPLATMASSSSSQH